MRILSFLMVALSTAAVSGAGAREEAGALQAATKAVGASELRSIEYSGTGRWFQFGQAPSPTLPWPAFDGSRLTARVNPALAAQRAGPGRARPPPAEQRQVQVVSGAHAWNMAVPAAAPPDTAPTAQPQVEA